MAAQLEHIDDINDRSTVLWKARATWLVNLGTYLYVGIFILVASFVLNYLEYNYPSIHEIAKPIAIVVVLGLLIKCIIDYLQAYFEIYTITKNELIVEKGILTKNKETLELIRIRDVTIKIPYYLAPFGRANLYVYSPSDASTPITLLRGVKDYQNIEQTLTKLAREILSKSAPVIGG